MLIAYFWKLGKSGHSMRERTHDVLYIIQGNEKFPGCLSFDKRNHQTKTQVWINQKEGRGIENIEVREEKVRVSRCGKTMGKKQKHNLKVLDMIKIYK